MSRKINTSSLNHRTHASKTIVGSAAVLAAAWATKDADAMTAYYKYATPHAHCFKIDATGANAWNWNDDGAVTSGHSDSDTSSEITLKTGAGYRQVSDCTYC